MNIEETKPVMLTLEERAIVSYLADHYRNGGFASCVKPLRFLQNRYGDDYPAERTKQDIYSTLCKLQFKMLPQAKHMP